ncbi:hypothetical protein ACR79N_16235 [Sphingobacterium siyangense]|uniref:hypothetical protein n=1 Tax=Sphingobacterium siyangense TaxID=459529 RepID=UPI003DA2A089
MSRAKQKLNRVILAQDRMLNAFEKKYNRVVFNALRQQINDSINTIGSFDPKPMADALESLYQEVFMTFVRFQYDTFTRLTTKSADFFIYTWLDAIRFYITQHLDANAGVINETTKKNIQQVLDIGRALGYTATEMVEFLGDKFSDFNLSKRARTITRTEIGRIGNIAKDQAKDDWKSETGEPIFKIWVHRYAKVPRDWHLSMDNDKAIPENQLFEVTDPKDNVTEYMMRPHADGVSAKNSINCGCIVIYVSESYAQSLNSGK